MSSNWIERFTDPNRRLNFVRQRTAAHIAMQLRAMREDRGWSQTELESKSGIKQSVLSRCEKIGYGKYTVTTLLRLAEAFDVALDVSFVSYGELWRRERKLANEPLVPQAFSAEASERKRRRPKNVVDLAKWVEAQGLQWIAPAAVYEGERRESDGGDIQMDLIPHYAPKHEVAVGGVYVSYTT